MEEAAFPRADKMHTSRTPKAILILVGVLILVGLLVFGAMKFFGTGSDEESDTSDVLPTAVIAPSSTPTPSDETPTPTVDEEQDEAKATPTPTKTQSSGAQSDSASLSIQVLNGSGVSGAAGEVKTALEDAGYTNVTTGNADSFDYEGLTISVSKTKSNFLKQLETDLSDSYTISDTDTDLSSSDYDVVITVGK